MEGLKQKVYQAAKKGKHREIESLLKGKGIKEINQVLNHLTKDGEEAMTPLLIASRECHPQVIELLLNVYGVYSDQTGTVIILQDQHHGNVSPLWITAAHTGNIEIAEKLLKAGANVNYMTRELSSPLRAATYHSNLEMVNLLINYGADVNICNKDGKTPLMNLSGVKLNTSVTKVLLKMGANPNARSNKGASVLHHCVDHGSPEEAAELFKYGAILHVADYKGVTPIQDACDENKEEILAAFLKSKDATPKDKIEAHELMGATLISKDEGKGIQYMIKAMKERDYYHLKKVFHPCSDLYEGRRECTTIAELNNIKDNQYLLLLEGLMISERILGQMHRNHSYNLRYTAAVLADDGKHSKGLPFVLRVLEVEKKTGNISMGCLSLVVNLLAGTLTSLKSFDINTAIGILESAAKEMENCITIIAQDGAEAGAYAGELLELIVQMIGLYNKLNFSTTEKTKFYNIVKNLCSMNGKNSNGQTMLHIACLQETYTTTDEISNALPFPNTDIAKILFKCEANPNVQDHDGNTPLHIIVQYVKLTSEASKLQEIVAIFVDAKANMELKNKAGQNPLQVAAKNINKAIETGQLTSGLKRLVKKIGDRK